MKVSKIGMLVLACLAIVSISTGCKSRRPKDLTVINGKIVKPPVEPTPTTVVDTNLRNSDPKGPDIGLGNGLTEPGKGITTEPIKPDDKTGGFPQGYEDIGDMMANPTIFESNTVYFDLDRSEVKSSERTKVDEVAVYLKGDATGKLLIEGHCDERGTEEYNRSLGERRALSIREYMINAGIAAERIHTISFGEDKPAVPGHAEAAWAKNRRGVFVLLKPKQ